MFAEDRQRCECDVLERALAKLPGAERMVVGHTIQVWPGLWSESSRHCQGYMLHSA